MINESELLFIDPMRELEAVFLIEQAKTPDEKFETLLSFANGRMKYIEAMGSPPIACLHLAKLVGIIEGWLLLDIPPEKYDRLLKQLQTRAEQAIRNLRESVSGS